MVVLMGRCSRFQWIALLVLGCALLSFFRLHYRQGTNETANSQEQALWKKLLPFSTKNDDNKNANIRGLTLWSSDFHISPIEDIKHVVAKYGINVIDKSLSGHCHLTGTCERDLRVINKQNGINLHPCPNRLRTGKLSLTQPLSNFTSTAHHSHPYNCILHQLFTRLIVTTRR